MREITRDEMVEVARHIHGRYSMGLVDISEGAYRALGAARCLQLLTRYADQDGPADDLPGWGPVHQAEYVEDGQRYVILSERCPRQALRDQLQHAMTFFERVEVRWLPRESNHVADSLSRRAYELACQAEEGEAT
jgi:hypothetical protein